MSNETIEAEVDPLAEDNENDEMAILAELNQGQGDVIFRVRVSRILGAAKLGGKEAYLFEIDGSEMGGIHERLKNYCKPGEIGNFRVRIFKNNRLAKRTDIQVERPAESFIQEQKQNTSELSQILQEMQRQNMAMMQEVIRTVKESNQSPPAVDPFAMLERASTIFANIGGSRNNGADTSQLVNVFSQGVELAKSLGNAAGSERGISDIIIEAIKSPAVENLFSGFAAAANAANAAKANQQSNNPQENNRQSMQNIPERQLGNQRVIIPGIGEVNAPPVNMQQGKPISVDGIGPRLQPEPIAQAPISTIPLDPNQVKNANDELTAMLNETLKHASENADPALYAGYLYDNVSDEMLNALLNTENFVDMLIQFDNRVLTHRTWFDRTLAELHKIDDDMSEQSEPSNGIVKFTVASDQSTRRGSGDEPGA